MGRRFFSAWGFVTWGLVGIVLSVLLGLGTMPAQGQMSPAGELSSDLPGNPFEGHPLQDCVTALTQQQVFDPVQLQMRYPADPITQVDFSAAVLRAFPGDFAAANEALGLTFNDAATESEALLMAALGNHAEPRQRVLRSQALAVLATGSASPVQPDATHILRNNYRDHLLIPRYAREGVAAALVQGFATDAEGTTRQLAPLRNATAADAAAFLCLASPDERVVATVPTALLSRFERPNTLPIPDNEMRGVWLTNIDSDVLFSREKLETGLNRLASLNFNTVYPTIWNWGYTLYPSQIAQRTIGHAQGLYPDLANTGRRNEALEAAQADRDMLQEAIDIAHPLGMRVLPWFEFGFMVPADSELARRHPGWLTHKADGSTVTMEGSHPRAWLNPFHPDVQRFMLYLIDEVMSQYDVDGFQVDDHMGLPVAYGYDDYTKSLYQQDHGGKLPPDDARDPEWVQWRSDQISNFIRQMFQVMKARNSDAIFSVSPNPHPWSQDNYLQDWKTWVNKGYVEELVIQLYRSDLGRFVWEMQQDAADIARRHIPTSIGILSGLRGRPVPMSRIQEQVNAVRDRNYAGVSFFFYETLWLSDTETLEQRQTALRNIFPNQVPAPSLAHEWKPPG